MNSALFIQKDNTHQSEATEYTKKGIKVQKNRNQHINIKVSL